jgi:hypothetical protein
MEGCSNVTVRMCVCTNIQGMTEGGDTRASARALSHKRILSLSVLAFANLLRNNLRDQEKQVFLICFEQGLMVPLLLSSRLLLLQQALPLLSFFLLLTM